LCSVLYDIAYHAAWASDLLLVFGLVLHRAPHPAGLGCNLEATEEHSSECCYLWLTDRGAKQKLAELSKDSRNSVTCPRLQRKPGTVLKNELNTPLLQLPNDGFFFNQLINLALNH